MHGDQSTHTPHGLAVRCASAMAAAIHMRWSVVISVSCYLLHMAAAARAALLLPHDHADEVDGCTVHNSCASCLQDGACGWCTGDIGGGNPGRCLSRPGGGCDTVFETQKCPDCHLPWIRFANTVPSEHTLDCTITQGSVSHSWKGYAFAQFSDWSQTFAVGKAQITIASSGQQLLSVSMPLTPGPLGTQRAIAISPPHRHCIVLSVSTHLCT
jgi:hypothetical protein